MLERWQWFGVRISQWSDEETSDFSGLKAFRNRWLDDRDWKSMHMGKSGAGVRFWFDTHTLLSSASHGLRLSFRHFIHEIPRRKSLGLDASKRPMQDDTWCSAHASFRKKGWKLRWGRWHGGLKSVNSHRRDSNAPVVSTQVWLCSMT